MEVDGKCGCASAGTTFRVPGGSGIDDELLRIDVDRPRAGVAVASLHGEVDILSAPTLRDCMQALLLAEVRVILDTRGCRLLGSAGLTVLVEMERLAKDRGGELLLVIAPESRSIRAVLTMVGLADLVPVARTVRDAVGPVIGP